MSNEEELIIDLTEIVEQGKVKATKKHEEEHVNTEDLFDSKLTSKVDAMSDPSLDDLLNSIDTNSTSKPETKQETSDTDLLFEGLDDLLEEKTQEKTEKAVEIKETKIKAEEVKSDHIDEAVKASSNLLDEEDLENFLKESMPDDEEEDQDEDKIKSLDEIDDLLSDIIKDDSSDEENLEVLQEIASSAEDDAAFADLDKLLDELDLPIQPEPSPKVAIKNEAKAEAKVENHAPHTESKELAEELAEMELIKQQQPIAQAEEEIHVRSENVADYLHLAEKVQNLTEALDMLSAKIENTQVAQNTVQEPSTLVIDLQAKQLEALAKISELGLQNAELQTKINNLEQEQKNLTKTFDSKIIKLEQEQKDLLQSIEAQNAKVTKVEPEVAPVVQVQQTGLMQDLILNLDLKVAKLEQAQKDMLQNLDATVAKAAAQVIGEEIAALLADEAQNNEDSE